MYCNNCGNEIADAAVICVHCGCSVNQNRTTAVNTGDAPSTGMSVLGFFVPLAGLIIWLLNKDTKPLMAKSAGKGAIIGFVASMIFSIIYGVVMGVMFSSYYYF